MKSKYLGKTFGDWKVTNVEKTKGHHRIYTLKRKKFTSIESLTIRDNELTKLSRNKSVADIILGKTYQLTKNIRVDKNRIFINNSLFNLFKNI